MENMPRDKIAEWLRAFPVQEQDYEELRARAVDLQDQIVALQQEYGLAALELAKMEQALAFRDRFMRDLAGTEVNGDGPRRQKTRGRSAVLQILRDSDPTRKWRAKDVQDEMIRRGWATADENVHPVRVSLSRLARDKKIARAGHGVYQLLGAGEEAATRTDVQGKGGDESQGHGDPRVVTEGLLLATEG